jgi:hypothetical protein
MGPEQCRPRPVKPTEFEVEALWPGSTAGRALGTETMGLAPRNARPKQGV